MSEKILEGLNRNQLLAVKHFKSPAVVIAGAGSGKTKVLISRIAYLIKQCKVKPQNILATTFTKKASEEMKERLVELIGVEANNVTIGTFHSICFSILREHWKNTRSPKQWYEIGPKWKYKKIASDLLKAMKWDQLKKPNEMQGWVGFQKNNLISPEEHLLLPDEKDSPERYRYFYRGYEFAKAREKLIEFDDMLIECYYLLRDNPEVLAYYQKKYQFILVDEYQDTNSAQEGILKLLAGENKNVFVVGDDKQSIYGFRSANVELIVNFRQQWGTTNIYNLDTNYRSQGRIVDIANCLIKNNISQVLETIFTRANKKSTKDVVYNHYADENAEGEAIVNEMKALLAEGYSEKDITVLYRTNSQSRAIEDELIKASIPYVIVGGLGFYNRKEIKDIIAYLTLIIDDNDYDSFKRVINTPTRYLGNTFVDKVTVRSTKKGISLVEAVPFESKSKRTEKGSEFYSLINKLKEFETPAEMVDYIRIQGGYDKHMLGEEELNVEEQKDILENLNSLSMSITNFKTVKSFLAYIELVKQAENNKETTNAVKLMTIHRSKGLEFPIVFVAGVCDGLLPHIKADGCGLGNIGVEEERRLAYVAVTRAIELLYVSSLQFYNGKEIDGYTFINEMQGLNLEEVKEQMA